jgi:carbonic anhydrase
LTETDQLIANNRRHAEAFTAGDLPPQPARRVAVLTCMDARLDPARALGLEAGDAHVIRNAGGVVTDDAIRSLAISQRLLGTEAVLVIHHTRCGMAGLDDDDFAAELERDTGQRPAWRAHGFSDIEADVRESMRAIERSPFLPRTGDVRGFVYDVDSGALREVGAG